jgi:hypothetical protein
MELQEIDVYIDADGEVRLEVRGMAGRSCLDLTAGLEAALGAEVISRELTAEAAADMEASETQRQQLGREG